MGWSGGVYTKARDWTSDEAGGIDMLSVNFDQQDDNFESGINACLTKDGANSPSANLPMGGNRHTGVGNAAAKDDYASGADVIDQDLVFYVDTGAADAYVVTPSPSIAAYEEGQRLVFRATNVNTGASTLNANALGAIAIQTNGGNALAAGMIADGGYYEVTYDANAAPDRWVLTSPHSLNVNSLRNIIAGTGLTGGGTLAADRTLNVIGGTGITANANDIATDDSAIVHDSLSGFVANEHIDHSGVTMTAGAGMTGGGTIAATRTLNCIGGTGITVNANDIQTNDSAIVHDNLSGFVADEHVAHASVTITAGAGMTGGGTIAATRTLNCIGGTGITVNADDIALSATVAGAGMTHTAGVLNVIGGNGITANANDIELSSTVPGAGMTMTTGVINVIGGDGITANANDIALSSSAGGAGLTYTTGVLAVAGGTGITVNANDIETDLTDNYTWTGTHSLDETWGINGVISDSFSAQQDNYAPTGHATASVWRITPTGSQNISGIAGGVAGRRIQIFNLGSSTVTLQDENASSSAANRIRTSGAGLGITEQGGVELWYDGTSSRWRICSNP